MHAPACDGLEHADAQARDAPQRRRDCAGDYRLADLGVGRGDEERRDGRAGEHGQVTAEISITSASTIVRRSSTPIASGGISTMTSPNGRTMTPCFRIARQTAAPTRRLE